MHVCGSGHGAAAKHAGADASEVAASKKEKTGFKAETMENENNQHWAKCAHHHIIAN